MSYFALNHKAADLKFDKFFSSMLDIFIFIFAVVKQRLQMYGSPFKTCSECVRYVWRTEGASAFYRSYTTQLTMNIPFQSIHFMTYELMQQYTNKSGHYNPKAHMVSGAVAGAIAAAVTTPLDVCKTLLNTQESAVTGMLNAARMVNLLLF
jgi:solute carrier family 25 (mitochondrial iron transporter), member 28/37